TRLGTPCRLRCCGNASTADGEKIARTLAPRPCITHSKPEAFVRLSKRVFFLAGVAACGGGTISPDNFVPPTVRVHHLAVKNAGISGGTMDVVMAFYNPNRGSIQGTRLQGGMDIENTHIGELAFADPFKLKGHDTTLVTVPMQF